MMTDWTAAAEGDAMSTRCFRRHHKRQMKFMEEEEGREENDVRSPFREQKCKSIMLEARLTRTSIRQSASNRGFRFLLLLSCLIYTCETAGPYGTDNGYDNEGGTEPICWDSKVRWEESRVIPNTTAEADDNFDIMNGKLFASNSTEDDLNVKLRKSCYQDMNLTVTPNFSIVRIATLKYVLCLADAGLAHSLQCFTA